MGDRLIEQKQLGLAHDGPADGDALLLAAGQFLRAAIEQLVDLQQLAADVTRSLIVATSGPRSESGLAMLSKTVLCG